MSGQRMIIMNAGSSYFEHVETIMAAMPVSKTHAEMLRCRLS